MATELRPFRSESDYEAALVDVERLWGVKSGTPAYVPPPLVKKALYAGYGLEDLLALCADCGFAPDNSKDRRAVLAQLDAYYLGRGQLEFEKVEAKKTKQSKAALSA